MNFVMFTMSLLFANDELRYVYYVAEASYLKFTLPGERRKNRLKNYFIVPFLLIVIAFLLYVIII